MGITISQYRCSVGLWYMSGPKKVRTRAIPSTACFVPSKMVLHIGLNWSQPVWKSQKCCAGAMIFLFILLTIGGEYILQDQSLNFNYFY